jgi:hypothetical protein
MSPLAILVFLLSLTLPADAIPGPHALLPSIERIDQQLQSAARLAAEQCLKDTGCLGARILDAPLGELDAQRSRRLRELAVVAEAALMAHTRELSRLILDLGAHASQAATWRLDRFGTGELRLGDLAGYVEVAIHLRGRILAPDGAQRAAVVYFAERSDSGEPRPPRVRRLLLPIAGVELVGSQRGALPAPLLGWRGAILDELAENGWSRVLSPSMPMAKRRRVEAGFCDAACAGSALAAPRPDRAWLPLP